MDKGCRGYRNSCHVVFEDRQYCHFNMMIGVDDEMGKIIHLYVKTNRAIRILRSRRRHSIRRVVIPSSYFLRLLSTLFPDIAV